MTRIERAMTDELHATAHRLGLTLGIERSGDQSVHRVRVEARAPDGLAVRLDIAETDHDAAGRPGRYWYGLILPSDPRGPFYVGYHCHEELEQQGEGDLPHRVVRIDGARAHWRRESRPITIAAAIEALLGDLAGRDDYTVQEQLRPEPGETWRAYRRRKIAAARAA
jgi:hypothetical protein